VEDKVRSEGGDEGGDRGDGTVGDTEGLRVDEEVDEGL
jgi:hypothetical protein